MGKYTCEHPTKNGIDADVDYRCRDCWYDALKPEPDKIVETWKPHIENARINRSNLLGPPMTERQAEVHYMYKDKHQKLVSDKDQELAALWKEFDEKYPDGRDQAEDRWTID